MSLWRLNSLFEIAQLKFPTCSYAPIPLTQHTIRTDMSMNSAGVTIVIPENEENADSKSDLEKSVEMETEEFESFRKSFIQKRGMTNEKLLGSSDKPSEQPFQRRASISLNNGANGKKRQSVGTIEEGSLASDPQAPAPGLIRRQSISTKQSAASSGSLPGSAIPATISESSEKQGISRKATFSKGNPTLVDLNQLVKPARNAKQRSYHRSAIFQKISPIARFRAAVEAVLKSKKATSIFVFKGPADEPDEDENEEEEAAQDTKAAQNRTLFSNLQFNFDEFKARRIDILTPQTREVLKKPPDARTSLDIDLLLPFVQAMKPFARQSMNMKREICKILKQESFGRGRTMIKQGHYASCFYHIVSGHVTVTKEEKDGENPDSVPTIQVSELKGGDSFGESVLSKDKEMPRPYTVKNLKKCEFLKVEKDPYWDIVKQNFEQSVHKRIEVLSKVSILSDISPAKLETLASLSKAAGKVIDIMKSKRSQSHLN